MKRRSIIFDPRTKIIILFAINLLLLLSHSIYFEIAIFFSSVIVVFLGGEGFRVWKYLFVFAFLFFINDFIFSVGTAYVLAILSFIALAIRKFLPCFIIGKWILQSTKVSEFVAAMREINLPQTAIIPLSVMFRYFPTIKEEWTSIRMAMRIRGIHFSFERMIVPLLISAINTSEELSAASLCRGLDNPGKHSSLQQVKFKIQDMLLLIYFALFASVSFVLKGVGAL